MTGLLQKASMMRYQPFGAIIGIARQKWFNILRKTMNLSVLFFQTYWNTDNAIWAMAKNIKECQITLPINSCGVLQSNFNNKIIIIYDNFTHFFLITAYLLAACCSEIAQPVSEELMPYIDLTGDGKPEKITLTLDGEDVKKPMRWSLTIRTEKTVLPQHASDDSRIDAFFSDAG